MRKDLEFDSEPSALRAALAAFAREIQEIQVIQTWRR